MQIQSSNQHLDPQKKQQQQKAVDAAVAFSAALDATTKNIGSIMPTEDSHKQQFKQKKITTVKATETEQEESESEILAKTVTEMAKKLKSLAELERNGLGL